MGTSYSGVGTAASDCTECSAGHYAAEGSANCMACPAATKLEAGVGASVDDCHACQPGSYAPPASTDCFDCPAGKYATVAGTSEDDCQDCAPGLTSERASAECYSCPLGTITDVSLDEPCVACPAGKYLDVASTDINHCQDCAVGQFAPAGSPTCYNVRASCDRVLAMLLKHSH
jgi:hypothetical protein